MIYNHITVSHKNKNLKLSSRAQAARAPTFRCRKVGKSHQRTFPPLDFSLIESRATAVRVAALLDEPY